MRPDANIAEIIRHKRDGEVLSAAAISSMVTAIATGEASEGQVAAFAMAVFLRGMEAAECVALTRAMAHSGETVEWASAQLPGPVLDKHSSGGVGDKVSLILAPLLAAAGAHVPMVSGRGLGHTGGTLDKLEAIPGYTVDVSVERLRRVTKEAGCAIVGATPSIAPADRRLYAVRDVTATVESLPLITASILSKKLAAGVDALVMDIKTGSGAFAADLESARHLARSIVDVACAAGLATTALVTDMNQVLGTTAGNALEVREAIDVLTGAAAPRRLMEVTLALGAQVLVTGGLAASDQAARALLDARLDDGSAAEHFAAMVRGLGGPGDLLARPSHYLAEAPVVREARALASGTIAAVDTRALGMLIVGLGGGRRRPDDMVEPAVGLDAVLPIGTAVTVGDRLARVHATTAVAAENAIAELHQAYVVGDSSEGSEEVIIDRLGPR